MNTQKKRLNKKWILIAAVGVAVLAAVIYVWASASAWGKLGSSVADAEKNHQKQALVLRSDKSSSQDVRLALDEINKSNFEELCKTSWWYDWQKVVSSSANEQVDECEDSKTQILETKQATQALADFIQQDIELADILDTVNPGSKALADKTWVSVQKEVSSAQERLKSIVEIRGSQHKVVDEKALQVLSQIDEAWTKLVSADKAEKKKDYLSAIDNLDARYQQLGSITELSEAELDKLIASLDKALK